MTRHGDNLLKDPGVVVTVSDASRKGVIGDGRP